MEEDNRFTHGYVVNLFRGEIPEHIHKRKTREDQEPLKANGWSSAENSRLIEGINTYGTDFAKL